MNEMSILTPYSHVPNTPIYYFDNDLLKGRMK